MFSWVTITPLGSIVDPEVYWRNRIFEVSIKDSSEIGFTKSSVTIHGRPRCIDVNAGRRDSTSR